MDHKEIIGKIRKLIELSQSNNEHEAASAAAKAQILLSKYNLSMAEIDTNDESLKARRVGQKTCKRLDSWAHILARGVSKAFDCDYYHSATTGTTVFVGVGADPEVCGYTYDYLRKKLSRLVASYISGACSRLCSTKSKRDARKSFLIGALCVIIERLEKQKKHTPITPGALVLVKDAAIKAKMPETKSKKLSVEYVQESDYHAGMRAGLSIPLSTPLTGSNTSRRISN